MADDIAIYGPPVPDIYATAAGIIPPDAFNADFHAEIRRLSDNVYGGQPVPRDVWQSTYDAYATRAGKRTIGEIATQVDGSIPDYWGLFKQSYTEQPSVIVPAIEGVTRFASDAIKPITDRLGMPLVLLAVIAVALAFVFAKVKP